MRIARTRVVQMPLRCAVPGSGHEPLGHCAVYTEVYCEISRQALVFDKRRNVTMECQSQDVGL